MPVEISADRAVFFDTDDFAVDATWQRGSSAAVAVVAIVDQPVRGLASGLGLGISDTARRAHLQSGQVPSVQSGDTLTIDGLIFVIANPSTDRTGRIHTVELREEED